MKTLFALAAVLVLAACVSGGNAPVASSHADTLESWIGAPEGELVNAWGRPDDVYDFAAGGREVSYIDRRYVNNYTYECISSFTIDATGTIVDWAYSGNDC